MFYAAKNTHATETSIGFANTWYVIGFATKESRDQHIKNATDRATQAINADELKKYDAKHGEVSYYDKAGAFFAHIGHGKFARDNGIDHDGVDSYWDSK